MRILIFGTFDVLHPGHRAYIEQARSRGEVTAIVARDANVLHIKGRPPLQSEGERKAVIEEAFPDVRVVLGDGDDFLAPVRAAHPDLILLGYDQQLPPGVTAADLPCTVERAEGFEIEKFKSSLRRNTVSP